MKQILAGYLVLRNGETKMHGSIRGELADDSPESRKAACERAKESVRTRLKLGSDDDIRIMAFADAPVGSAREM